ncbi:acetolactate decarboxylase [bacterium]|nr:acetolactate decarboxylase [bacterium]MBU1883260.1 acetolactate decarboxylase [bacterium]
MKNVKHRNMLYQVGTINSLLRGVYEGDMFFDELTHYGDFGLGTFDEVNGEMIALEGRFYRIDADGNARLINGEMKTPFAVITHFRGYDEHSIGSYDDIVSFEEDIQKRFESRNIIYAILVEGAFENVELRSEHPQPKTHRPLSETISEVQTKFSFEDIEGSMVGFWFPKYMNTINVPGFHFHFIDKDKKHGGHLFDMRLKNATVKIVKIFDFGMHLIHTPLFENSNLDQMDEAGLNRVEK